MQTAWITRGKSDKLKIVVLGWAADPSMVVSAEGFDTICIYDYRTIEPIESIFGEKVLMGYKEIHLIAWSYGVWAAEQIFSNNLSKEQEQLNSLSKSETKNQHNISNSSEDQSESLSINDNMAESAEFLTKNALNNQFTFTSATAINGTPLPTHPDYGIPKQAFDLTVENIEKVGTSKFAKRMCVGMEHPIILKRNDSECVEELKRLAESFNKDYTPRINWTAAIIGMKDLIFPPAAQKAYWEKECEKEHIFPPAAQKAYWEKECEKEHIFPPAAQKAYWEKECEKEHIFPPAAQKAYWEKECENKWVKLIFDETMPHYPVNILRTP